MQRRQRTLEAVKRLLLREAQAQPLLVIFEDLHWIDSETQVLLDGLVESLPTARVLLLVTYRPEYHHAWGSKTFYTQLRLDTLPPETAGELLDALLGPDASLAPLKALLATKTGGNPLFLEESVRTLVETKALLGERGTYRLAQPVEAAQVPPTVQAILAARIDRLSPEEKRLLETAAVIGKDVPFPLLQAIAGESEETLRRGLARLRTAEFLYETTLFPDLEYTFKHALTHEVAYGTVLQERRRLLHARIVEAIERLYPDRLPEHVERLAHHAFRAETWDKAARYFREAGLKAAARSAHREAIPFFEQALVALGRTSEDEETGRQSIDLRLELRNSLHTLGEFEPMVRHLREAERLAEAVGDERRLGRTLAFLANHFTLAGDPVQALAAAQRVAAIAAKLGEPSLEFLASLRLALVFSSQGQYTRAQDFYQRNHALLQKFAAEERFGLAGLARVLNAYRWITSLAETGEFDEGIARAAEAIHLAEAADHLYSRAHAYFGAGHVRLRRGDLQAACEILERGLAFCLSDTVPSFFVYMGAALGHAYALGGRLAAATSLLDQSLARAVSIGMLYDQSLRLAWLAETHLLAGRADDAIGAGSRALELSRKHGERGNEAWVLRLLGEIAAHADPPEEESGVGHYREALGLATELGMRPLVAHCHLGLGKLFCSTGDQPKAQEHLTTAATMYRDMDMGFYLAQAQATLKEVLRR
jgi:tetratricopeptide (TPR) repeat protein